eukprot:TRINITY_DN2778_c0_g7_i1.p1 TRINITY_DN2778_c0_g7~~TRINITY_DN2778_c0_g7_i1.p1  ORF type:complete len:209 (+),score=6.99 TRINITY_DN2778_c0_g7_i1:38-628(+)
MAQIAPAQGDQYQQRFIVSYSLLQKFERLNIVLLLTSILCFSLQFGTILSFAEICKIQSDSKYCFFGGLVIFPSLGLQMFLFPCTIALNSHIFQYASKLRREGEFVFNYGERNSFFVFCGGYLVWRMLLIVYLLGIFFARLPTTPLEIWSYCVIVLTVIVSLWYDHSFSIYFYPLIFFCFYFKRIRTRLKENDNEN